MGQTPVDGSCIIVMFICSISLRVTTVKSVDFLHCQYFVDYRNRCGKIAHSHSDIKFPFPKYCFAVLSLLLSQSYSDTKWPHVDHLGLPQLSLPHLRLPEKKERQVNLPRQRLLLAKKTLPPQELRIYLLQSSWLFSILCKLS